MSTGLPQLLRASLAGLFPSCDVHLIHRDAAETGDLIALHGFEYTAFAVLADSVPGEPEAVHRDVDARGQCLREGQRAAQIEQPIRTAELVRNHGARQNDGLSGQPARGEILAEYSGGVAHRIGAVGDDNPGLRRGFAMAGDDPAVVAGHLKAVDHHQGAHVHIQQAAPEPQHLGQVRILEEELARKLVVLLVKSSAGDK